MTRSAVLDGGLPEWKADGRRAGKRARQPKAGHVSRRAPMPRSCATSARSKRRWAIPRSWMRAARRRFEGSEAEPRPGLRSGHMPGAANIPYRAVLTSDCRLKDDAALQKLFAEKGVDLRAPIITTCGSGVSAAILMLALEKLGSRQVALYDGSWAEWGGRDDAPVATGPA